MGGVGGGDIPPTDEARRPELLLRQLQSKTPKTLNFTTHLPSKFVFKSSLGKISDGILCVFAFEPNYDYGSAGLMYTKGTEGRSGLGDHRIPRTKINLTFGSLDS